MTKKPTKPPGTIDAAKAAYNALSRWLDSLDRKYHGDDYDIVQAAYDALELAIPTIEDYDNDRK